MSDFKPFNTYPEDRAKLLALADRVLRYEPALNTLEAIELADLVHAILTDERYGLDHGVYPDREETP
jgi:hypothetical protein